MPGDVDWNLDEIHLEDYGLPHLPDTPTCPNLVKLFLQVPGLAVIPPTFFKHMPMLKVLDLSNTNIVSLPTSISSLSLLKEFFLRDCSSLVELPTQIGMLSELRLFDIKGTELMFIPKEMGELKDLEVLRITLSQYAKEYIKNNVIETVIPRKIISKLKKLKELCVIVIVGLEPEWWEEEVKYLQNELCDLENLETLSWYLPTTKVLHQFLLLERNHVPIYANVSNLMLTIGQHAQLTSCLPHGLEKKFEEFKNCLKWVNAEGDMDDISKIIASADALFLSRHWTIEKLSTFNVTKLKYCLLAECNEMETLVEGDDLSEDVEIRIKNNETVGFELLQYLSIHYMDKLQSIWKGPIGKDCLSKLRILSLHTCSELTSIFTQTVAQNLRCLTVLIVEDCPKVTSLISNESNNIKLGPIFPSLEMINLLDLPMLVNIFDGQIVLENLRTILIYCCLQLRDLSKVKLPRITKIIGEVEWWDSLVSDKLEFGEVFEQLEEKRHLIEQLFKATNSLQHLYDTLPHENNERKSSTLTDIGDQVITADVIKGKEIFLPPEGFENQVRDLKEMVLKDKPVDDCSVVVVSGAAGCGKTSLVKMLCYDSEVQGKFGRNIYFATISRTYDLKVIIKNLLETNQLGKMPDFTSDEVAIQTWGSFLGENRSEILLVLDDVWSDSVIMHFKFKSPGYKILVTSRMTFNQFNTYQLGVLNYKDATYRKSPGSIKGLLLKEAFSELSNVIRRVEKKTWYFRSRLMDMKETIEKMRPIFEDMEKYLYRSNEEIEMFISLLKQADDLVRKCEDYKWNVWKTYRHASKLENMNRLLRKFMKSNLMFELARNVAEKLVDVEGLKKGVEKGKSSGWLSGVPLEKSFTIGLDDHIRDLKAMVLKDSPDGDCSVVVVSAAVGFGKTTLVINLCRDPEIQGRFGGNIYLVTVSHHYDKKVIIKNLLGELPGITDESAIQQWGSFLGKTTSEVLLVLDDVWSDSVIMDFKYKSPRYKVLVTSRITFNQFKTYQLPALNDQDATRLFQSSAFSEHENEYHHIPDDFVHKLVKCCKNHPLSLRVVGGMLKGKPMVNWMAMLKKLSEENRSIFDLHESLLYSLEINTYLFDEEPGLKQCYMDLGLFPEGVKIAAAALMDMWAHLYNHDEEGLATFNILTKLSSRNLATLFPGRKHLPYYFEEASVTQHDIMRALSIHLSSREPIEDRERLIINPDGQGLPDLPQTVNARIMSISTGEEFPITWNEVQAPHVEVVVINFMSNMLMHPLPQFMHNIKSLKVLIITNYGYSSSEVQNLPAVQHLSGLTRIRLKRVSISSISTTILQLENLQKLSLIMCKIGNSFTKGIPNKLASLMEIDIECCDDLVKFPAILCNLTRLKKLCITACFELTSLSEEFGNLLSLEVLRLASCYELPTLPESMRNLKKLRIIDLSHCLNLCELPQYIGELVSLQTVDVTGCMRLRKLPKSVKDFNEVKVVCDEEGSHLWSDFKNVTLEVVDEDADDAF